MNAEIPGIPKMFHELLNSVNYSIDNYQECGVLCQQQAERNWNPDALLTGAGA